jgi:DNA-binding NarL/FixJ family response regulator
MPIATRKILIVEDDALLARLIADALSDMDFEVATASDTASARKQIAKFDPDLLLLDLALGDGPTGVHLAHALHKDRPDIAILVLTKYSDAKSISSQALGLPPNTGFLRKQLVTDPDQLFKAIEEVLADRPSSIRHDLQQGQPFSKLPTKGQLVLRLLAEGFSNQEIAKQTGLSVKSVERWIERIYLTLEIDTSSSRNPRVAAANKYFTETGAADRR